MQLWKVFVWPEKDTRLLQTETGASSGMARPHSPDFDQWPPHWFASPISQEASTLYPAPLIFCEGFFPGGCSYRAYRLPRCRRRDSIIRCRGGGFDHPAGVCDKRLCNYTRWRRRRDLCVTRCAVTCALDSRWEGGGDGLLKDVINLTIAWSAGTVY